jgi:STE24 endopeptidase
MSVVAAAPAQVGPEFGKLTCPERQAAAERLGAERRRLFFISAPLSIAIPVLPYLTGTWETLWYALASTGLPLPLRTLVFLLAFYLAFAIVLLPLSYYGGFVLPRAFGLGRESWQAWCLDWLKGTLLGTALGLIVAGAFFLSVSRFADRWWVVFGALASLGTLVLVFITPYVLVPIFFKMRPLADDVTANRVRALVRRAGADVRDVCSLDFSRRTAEANAAVIGMGRSRRVVLADTLLAEFPPDEVDAVVAHEIGHHVHRDVVWLLAANLGVMWLGLVLAARLTQPALPLLSVPSLAYVPGFPMLVGTVELFMLLVAPLSNWWSRRLESAADRFALRLTGNPTAFAGAMQRLSCQNLVELRPPRWAEVLLATHPALHRRIALADRWSVAGGP